MKRLLSITLALITLWPILASLTSAPARAQEAVWVRGYPQRAADGCVEYVAEWSDGTFTSTPWDCGPGAAADRGGVTADRGYPQVAPNGCTEYVTQWSDGSYTWVPFSCPQGVTYFKRPDLMIPPVRAFPIVKESKLGIGVYTSGGHIMRALQHMEPGLILIQEPKAEFAQELRRNFPKAFIVGKRFQIGGQPLDNPRARGAAFADYVAQLAVPLKGVVDAWQSYNEPIAGGDPAQYAAWNEFQIAFAERLQGQHGIPAVAGNDPAGAIQPEEYATYFAGAIRASGYLGIHSYSSGKAPFRLNEESAEWYILRHRKIHQALEAAGVRNVRMILTETGHGEGWRNKIGQEEVAQDFLWLTQEVVKDDYVIGHAIFGLFDEGGNWGEFNLPLTVLDRFRAYPLRRPAEG